MSVAASFSGYELTDISRSLFNRDIFEYHLRTLVGRAGTDEEILRGISVSMDYGDINVYSTYEIEEIKTIMEDKKLVNILCQMRIISTNPITLYHRLLENEFRLELLDEMNSRTKLRMSELVVPEVDTFAAGKMKFEPFVKTVQKPFQEIPEKKKERTSVFEAKYISEGHVMLDMNEDEMYVPGQVSWKEGPIADANPDYVTGTIDDYEGGLVVSIFPGMPIYAYPHMNIYPAIQDLNRLIEAGNQVLFLETGSGEEREIYESIFSDWGIIMVDFVDEVRMAKNGMRVHGQSPIPPFYVIQRPQTVLHNSAWAGISNDRRRGLAGIPWAISKTEKPGMFNTQPDDGFLSYWLRDAYYKHLKGNKAVQVYFPIPTITPIYKIKKNVIDPLEKILDRQLYFTHYPEQCVAGVFLKNMGEWIAFRALLRKFS